MVVRNRKCTVSWSGLTALTRGDMRFFLVLAMAAIVGCSVPPKPTHEHEGDMRAAAGNLTQLNDAEVRATVEGHYIDIDRGADSIMPFQRERFCRGIYTTPSDRIPTFESTYSISDGRLCVGEGDSASCRTLHRDRNGRLYMRWLHGQSPDTWAPVEVGPLPGCSN